jgi:hypothetical protein
LGQAKKARGGLLGSRCGWFLRLFCSGISCLRARIEQLSDNISAKQVAKPKLCCQSLPIS